MKTFEDFRKFAKELSPITYVKLTKEEFDALMKPAICDICRRIFNPTDEERKQLKESLKTLNDVPFEWEIIKNN